MNEETTNTQTEATQITEQQTEQKTFTVDDFKSFLESNDEAKKILQAERDRAVTKGIETWKTNNLDSIINDKIKELFPEETAEQKRLRELEQKYQNMEKKAKISTLKNKVLNQLTETGLSTKLADVLVGEDEESTMSRFNLVKEIWENSLKAAVEQKFKENGRTPSESPNKTNMTKPFTAQEIENMTFEEINAAYQKNPERFKNLRR